jgi:sugar/nucleoside kinase (ribokinase family)
MFDICTIGAGTRDVFVRSGRFEREPSAEAPDGFNAVFPMGAKLALDDVVFETGGGATNAAVTFRHFGLRTACVCRVGNDDNGQAVIKALKKARVALRGVQTDPEDKTGYSIILLAGSGHRSILVYRGAAANLHLRSVPWRWLRSRWFYLTSLGNDLKKANAVFVQANKMGACVAWNPGNGELSHGFHRLSGLIRQTDILIMNREEAACLADEAPRHLDRIIAKIGHLPRLALVVTDGANGAYAFDPKTKGFRHGSALPGKRINTTGAGDAFGSGFVSAYIKTGDIDKALRAGLCNSLGVITHMGAKAGILARYPTERELNRARVRPSSL